MKVKLDPEIEMGKSRSRRLPMLGSNLQKDSEVNLCQIFVFLLRFKAICHVFGGVVLPKKMTWERKVLFKSHQTPSPAFTVAVIGLLQQSPRSCQNFVIGKLAKISI